MGVDDWYVLDEPSHRTRFYQGKLDCTYSELQNMWKYFYAEEMPSSPVKVVLRTGTKPGDFLRTDFLTELISQKVIDCLARSRITGWATYPVSVLDRGGRPLEDCYQGLAITGRTKGFDDSTGTIVERAIALGAPLSTYRVGMEFDSSGCTDDLCVSTETLFIFASQKVVDAFRRESISNIECVPVGEYGVLP